MMWPSPWPQLTSVGHADSWSLPLGPTFKLSYQMAVQGLQENLGRQTSTQAACPYESLGELCKLKLVKMMV